MSTKTTKEAKVAEKIKALKDQEKEKAKAWTALRKEAVKAAKASEKAWKASDKALGAVDKIRVQLANLANQAPSE